MSPAARVTLASLLSEKSLERLPASPDVCRHLLDQSGNHLRTAAAGADGGDPEGAFQLAYDACRKTCLALVLATGLRPKGNAAHAVTFEAAAAIADNFGARLQVVAAADLRFVRHGAEYRAESVSIDDARDAIDIGQDLLVKVAPRVGQILQSAS